MRNPAQKNNNWMNGRKMFRQKSARQPTRKHNLASEQTWLSKVQTLAAQEAKTWQLKQQRQQRKRQRRLKNDLVLKLRISRKFELIQFVYTVRIIQNRICKTASKFDEEILKIGGV